MCKQKKTELLTSDVLLDATILLTGAFILLTGPTIRLLRSVGVLRAPVNQNGPTALLIVLFPLIA